MLSKQAEVLTGAITEVLNDSLDSVAYFLVTKPEMHNALELQKSKTKDNTRTEEARSSEEAAMAIAEQERAKCKAAIEAAEAA
ncbi:hypothetical protein vseg_015018 [Gypsophila vaccaria]